jgi:hypothetical protein
MNAPQTPPGARLSDDPGRGFIAVLGDVAAASGDAGATVGEIADRLDERAFGLLILAFTLPCLVPGLPGAQLIAIPIFLLAAQVMIGRPEPWLPNWVLKANVKKSWLDGVAGFAAKRLAWTERLARPRLRFLASGVAERLLGLIMAVAAITVMLPITNTIPSLALTLMAIGLIQRDGLFTLGGAALACAWIGALTAVIVGFFLGAGFAVDFVAKHAPFLADWLNGPASP